MAELFQTTPQNVTLHLKEIFADRELDDEATCKDYLQVVRKAAGRNSRDVTETFFRLRDRKAAAGEATALFRPKGTLQLPRSLE